MCEDWLRCCFLFSRMRCLTSLLFKKRWRHERIVLYKIWWVQGRRESLLLRRAEEETKDHCCTAMVFCKWWEQWVQKHFHAKVSKPILKIRTQNIFLNFQEIRPGRKKRDWIHIKLRMRSKQDGGYGGVTGRRKYELKDKHLELM